MDYTQLVMLVFLTKCVAVNIKKLTIPPQVESGADSVILDCAYSLGAVTRDSGLVVKWFFNENNLVYQWIPPHNPQVIGLLKDKIDKNFNISDEPLQAYRAIRILRPTTHMSGNYTCVVSTFLAEERQTKSMLVYSSGKNFQFVQEKKYVFLVTLLCMAEELYPKPIMTIYSDGVQLKQATYEWKMDSWGLYSVRTTAVVHDDDVSGERAEFVCELILPDTGYNITRTTVYYPGLMPTAQIAAVEVEKPLQQHANKCPPLNSHCPMSSLCLILYFVVRSSDIQ